MLQARAVLDLADALDEELERRRRPPAAAPTSSCRWSTCWPRWSRPASPSTPTTSRRWRRIRRRGAQAAARRPTRSIGKEINLGSPKQLQVVLFDELGMPKTKRTKTGYTTDADALQELLREDRAPVPGAPAAAPRRDPAAADRRGTAQVGRRRRPHPHDVQPDDRGHRPAVQHRPQPAEHPDPHRGGPPDPRGVRRRRGLRVAADRRLQPDRDADHGPPVRGRRR